MYDYDAMAIRSALPPSSPPPMSWILDRFTHGGDAGGSSSSPAPSAKQVRLIINAVVGSLAMGECTRLAAAEAALRLSETEMMSPSVAAAALLHLYSKTPTHILAFAAGAPLLEVKDSVLRLGETLDKLGLKYQ
jgi:hypothetical protein